MASKPKQPTGPAAHQIEINAQQFAMGMASSDYALDGGFSPNTTGINLKLVPGTIYGTEAAADQSATLAAPFIASVEDSQAALGFKRLFVDGAANYYTWDGTTLTKSKTGTATSHYTFGKTDMASLNHNTYITLDNDVALWNTSGTGTLTESWWVGTKTQGALNPLVPHPMVVYKDVLYIADGSQLNAVDYNGNINPAATPGLTLPGGELIHALGIDPWTGLMLISVQVTVNYSGTYSSRYYIYFYDGMSVGPRRTVPIEDLVTAFYNVGGVVYVGYGQNLGQLTPYGSGIQFLRQLANADLSGTDLLYKHHFANIGNTLYVVDGQNILAYGPVSQKAPPVFYNVYQATNKITSIANVGDNKLGFSYAGTSNNVFFTFDVTSTAAGVGSFYTTKINFPRKAWIRLVRVITTGITTTNPFGIGDIALIDETTHITNPTTLTFVNTGSSTQYTFDFPFNKELQTAQVRINLGTQGFGIVRIIIYYDGAE